MSVYKTLRKPTDAISGNSIMDKEENSKSKISVYLVKRDCTPLQDEKK